MVYYAMAGSYGEPTTVTYDLNTYALNSTGTSPFFLVPATPVHVQKNDSPLAWLRTQVEEIAELARAA